MTTHDDQLRAHLDSDTARLLRLIATIAPEAGLEPGEVARLDQLAAAGGNLARDHVDRAT